MAHSEERPKTAAAASKGRERRKYPRIEARIKVTFRTVAELMEEFTRNISAGGIFLKTDRPIDPNATIDLSMEFPEGLGIFAVKGRVVRLMSMSHPDQPGEQLHGVGIRFIDPSPEIRDSIQRLIDEELKKGAP